ncbi:MAG TPA: hypothetical protein VFS43_21990 [Polyangiaceae bacterium]|nr:hypothetical protein [Polyangiaceae bacterium]
MQPTNFLGAPKVPGGPDGCRARCTQWGLEFTGMVAMGEYSDGCVCQVPQRPAPATAAGQAAAVGVVLQMRAREEQARQQRHPWGPARPPPSPAFRR